jgi:protein O-mannosyl-transferase
VPRKSAREVPDGSRARKVQPSYDGIWWLKYKYLLAALAVCTIALLAYSDSFRSGFVLDNRPLILQDPRLSQATSSNVELILQHSYWWPTAESSLYRPFTTLSYLVNYSVLGEHDHPAGYHWFNFFLHALNTVLLFLLSLRFLKMFWPAAFIAALWAVHPVLTESVTNIIGRSDLLAAAALMSGFLFYLKSTESKGWPRIAWLSGLAAVTFIGVFSKESAVAILGVIALYELTWWKDRKEFQGLALGCAAIAPAFLALFYERSVVLTGSLDPELIFVDNPLVGAHFWTARLTSIAVMARYLWLLLWPARLSCDYSYAAIPLASGRFLDWIDWIAVATVVIIVAWQFAHNKLLFFFATFAFITFVPVSNLLFPIGTIMAERFLYLPAAGLAVCVVLVVYSVGQRVGSRALAPAMLCLIVATLGIRTWVRNLDWRDDITLWTSAAHVMPDSFKSHAALALALFQSDPTHSNIDRVIAEAEKSVAILNSLPDAMNADQVYANTGTYYVIKGSLLTQPGPDAKTVDSPASIQAYERAQQFLKRGVSVEKSFDRTFRESERARGKSETEIPLTGSAVLYTNLAGNSMRLGDRQTAFDAAMYARLLDPQNLTNYRILSNALIAEGRQEDAAVTLVEGMMTSGNRDPWFLEALRGLYRTGLDPQGCAISQGARGESLNNSCETAHNEICQASADLTGIYRRKLRPDLADLTNQGALQLGCPIGP